MPSHTLNAQQESAGRHSEAWLQTVNAILDLKSGKLGRIWERRPLLQLCMALQDSIFTLPDSDITQKTLQSAISCARSLVPQGMSTTLLICSTGCAC